MERIKIKGEKREIIGTGGVKRLRRQDLLPAVMYSEGVNIALTIPAESLKILQKMHFSESSVIDMEITGGKKPESFQVLIKDTQYHPLTDRIIHIDFLKVSLKEKIKVHIPVNLEGEAKAVKEEGGILEQILREIEVEGLPLDIPEKITLDISGLSIGHSLHISDLIVPDKIIIITDSQAPIVTALAKKEEIVEDAEAEEGAATGGPEVLKEKKEASGQKTDKEESKKKE